MLVGFALPEGNNLGREQFVDLVRGVGFPTVQYVAQGMPWHWPYNDVRVVWHHDPCAQLVALALKEANGPGDKVGEFGIAQVTDAVTHIEVFVHAVGIPAEQFVLLMPSQRAFCCHRVLEDRVSLLFEAEQDFFRECPGLPKRGKISAPFSLEMRQDATEMKAADQRVWLFV
jgi:hypothetical protein